jgi:hypothetical protein
VRGLLAVLLCAILLTACGGGSKRLSREEYARRADATCRHFNERTKDLGSPSDVKGLVKLADQTLPLLERAIADLRRLQPPEDEEALAGRWLASLKRLRDDVMQIRDRAHANDLGGVAGLVPAATRDNEEAKRLAARLGMRVCTKDQS